MEVKVDNYLFKLDRSIKLIEVFYSDEPARPIGCIRVDENISEKEFHTEVGYWVMENSGF